MVWLECDRHDHTKAFGAVRPPMAMIERRALLEEARLMKRRVLCKVCFEYKSTSGACSC